VKTIYADFNDFAADGRLPLTCAGSIESIATLTEPLREGESVWLSDGELWVIARVFQTEGAWEAESDWQFEHHGPDQGGA
jgi:hypothetical protein